jgi:hypothetical protein
MHKWDRKLQPDRQGIRPVAWSKALDSSEIRELRSGRWRRSSHGRYVPVNTDRGPSQRVLEAHAILGSSGAVGGWAAAHWLGAPFNDGLDPAGIEMRPVLLCIGPTRHLARQSGIELSREKLASLEILMVRDLRVTNPVRTAFDLARRAPSLAEAVVSIDTLLECGLITQDDLREYMRPLHRWNGIPQARQALTLSRVGVRSPPETRIRVVWEIDAGLPPLLINVPVYALDGRLLGIADALDPESATVVEYDGEEHEIPENRASDHRRDRLFADHGLQVVRVDKHRMRGRTELIQDFARARLVGLSRDRRLGGLLTRRGSFSG